MTKLNAEQIQAMTEDELYDLWYRLTRAQFEHLAEFMMSRDERDPADRERCQYPGVKADDHFWTAPIALTGSDDMYDYTDAALELASELHYANPNLNAGVFTDWLLNKVQPYDGDDMTKDLPDGVLARYACDGVAPLLSELLDNDTSEEN